MATMKLKISEFRHAVDSLNWSRNDLGGATREEFTNMDAKKRLDTHISKIQELIPNVHPRFGPDIQRAQDAIGYAEKCIARWMKLVKERQREM